jgi:monoterpene epsilon-lactone hydrolase
MPSRQVLEVKEHWESTAAAMASMPPLDEWRDRTEKEWTKLTAEPGNVDYLEVDAEGVPAMWIVPKKCVQDRVLLCMHGGGYFSGSMYTHRKMFGHLAKAIGCRALSLHYRRSPEFSYPAQIDDTITAYRWLLDQGIEGRHIAFVGDSSGGGLAIAGLLRARDSKLPTPAGAMTISAWLDMELQGQSYETNREKDVLFRKEMVGPLVNMFLGERGDRRDPYASPAHAALKGLPRIYMQAGADEGLLDDSRNFAERAKREGVEVTLEVFPEMLHTFQMAAGRAPEADQALNKMADWGRRALELS